MTQTETTFSLDGQQIGEGAPCFIIAELGVNHNGDVELARRLIDVAAEAGAQAVKLQTFAASRLVSPHAAKALYQRTDDRDETTQLQMLQALELSAADHRVLQRHATAAGLTFMSTPFDEESADFLESLDVPAFKISSGDLTHLPLLRHIARKQRPMLISTGMATLDEVADAVEAIEEAGNPPIALFHCVSAYPADPAEANLKAMATLKARFGRPTGWSDHTTSPVVAWAATAMGAELLEKHLTLDHDLPGPDHRASANPYEFRAYVQGVRTAERALGDGHKVRTPSEVPIAAVARRSLVLTEAVAKGEVIGAARLAILRPGTGLAPSRFEEAAGRRARQDLAAGAVLTEELLD